MALPTGDSPSTPSIDIESEGIWYVYARAYNWVSPWTISKEGPGAVSWEQAQITPLITPFGFVRLEIAVGFVRYIIVPGEDCEQDENCHPVLLCDSGNLCTRRLASAL